MTTGKTIALTTWTFVSRVMSQLFSTLSRFVIAFLPRSNHLLISWLQSLSIVILETKKKKSVPTSTFSLSIYHAVMGPDVMILVCCCFFFLIFSLKPALSLSSFIFIKRLFSSSSLSAIGVVGVIYQCPLYLVSWWYWVQLCPCSFSICWICPFLIEECWSLWLQWWLHLFLSAVLFLTHVFWHSVVACIYIKNYVVLKKWPFYHL